MREERRFYHIIIIKLKINMSWTVALGPEIEVLVIGSARAHGDNCMHLHTLCSDLSLASVGLQAPIICSSSHLLKRSEEETCFMSGRFLRLPSRVICSSSSFSVFNFFQLIIIKYSIETPSTSFILARFVLRGENQKKNNIIMNLWKTIKMLAMRTNNDMDTKKCLPNSTCARDPIRSASNSKLPDG